MFNVLLLMGNKNKTKMNYVSLILSQLIMLVVGLVSEVSPSLGAIFASAPTGTPLSLYISVNGKEGLERQKAFLEFTAGSTQGCFGLMAFSLCTRYMVLYGGRHSTNLFVILSAGFLGYFAFYYFFKRIISFQLEPSIDDMNKKDLLHQNNDGGGELSNM